MNKRDYHRNYMRKWRLRHEYDWRKYANPETVKRNQARWLKDNKERRKKYIRDRYQSQVDQQREYQRIWKRKWRALNPVKARLSDQQRSSESKERRRIRLREYAKSLNGRTIRRAIESIRRARKKSCYVGDKTALERIYKRASELRLAGFNVVVDHVVPLSKGGKHTAENLQIISHSDNCRKYNSASFIPLFVFL